jgi:hypothetical protein
MVGSGAAAGLVRNPDEGSVDLLEGLGMPFVDNQTFPLGDSNERQLADCSWSYADYEDEVALMDAYVPHVAEGINERARREYICQSSSDAGAQDFSEANVAHIHNVGLLAEDYYDMARGYTALVWSLRSNISLYGITADVATFSRLGGIISLGTDWTYSGSMNMLRELECADQYNRDHLDGLFSDAELWAMATFNAAYAIGADRYIGALAPGFAADIAVFDGSIHSLHRAVIEADATDTVLVLRGGDPMYGEQDTLSELGSACDPVTVCTTQRSICLTSEFGKSYATLAQDVMGAYDAFFCSTPIDEPTCTPSRPGEFTGVLTVNDPDGDGIQGGADNCPSMFNPIRPLDAGAQADADGDGIGDACDPTPLPADIDADGVLNDADNCPFDVNPLQLDLDNDGKGEGCDVCETQPNPWTGCPAAVAPPVPIANARALANGTDVTVVGVVTGVASNGFSVQDPSIANGVNAGIWVFTGGIPTVSRGDEVQVAGVVGEYFTEKQIEDDSVTVLGTAPIPAPVRLTLAQAVDEVYEGVYVEITDAVLNDGTYDCAVDGAGCTDALLWEIGPSPFVVVYDKVFEDGEPVWNANIATGPVAGVMTFRWNRRRIMPTVTADLP